MDMKRVIDSLLTAKEGEDAVNIVNRFIDMLQPLNPQTK